MTSAKTGLALASITLLLCTASACGSGPTEGPKGPQLPPVAGYAATQPGYAGPTTAQPEKKALSEEDRARAREKVKFAEEQRKLDEAAAAAAVGDGDPPADAGPDPTGGNFTMAMAAAGLPATGAFTATIKTSKGEMRCKLFDDKAPVATANFVGLARGTRPWKARGQWVTKPAYDGTTFHRVIKGFMIQGGCPNTKAGETGMPGTGGPGYKIKAEFNAKSHVRGVLSMARSAHPDSAGSQFFICHGDAKFLDRQYTAFGQVIKGDEVLEQLANVPTKAGGGGEKSTPIDRVALESVTIVAQ